MRRAKKKVSWRDENRTRRIDGRIQLTPCIEEGVDNDGLFNNNENRTKSILIQNQVTDGSMDFIQLEQATSGSNTVNEEEYLSLIEYGPEFDGSEEDMDQAESDFDIEVYGNEENVPNASVERLWLNVPLYTGGIISLDEGMIMIEWLRSKHNFSDAAFADILRVLKKGLLPPRNCLPCDPRTFLKMYSINSPVEVYHKDVDFVIFNIEKQLREIIERNYLEMIEHKCFLRSSPFYDHCGKLYRTRVFHTINLSLYTDGGEIAKSARYSVWPIIATIRDLPPKMEKSIANTIWLGLSVPKNGSPIWNTIFKPIIEQIKTLEDGISFNIKRVDDPRISSPTPLFKVSFVELLADSMARKSLISLNGPTGYYSCPFCLIQGKHALGKVIFPHEKAPMRKSWIAGVDPGLKKDEISPIIEFMELPTHTGVDVMHCTYSGMFKDMVLALYHPQCNKNYFNSLEWNLLKPEEFNRNLRPLSYSMLFKANEWRLYCLYFSVILFQGIRHIGRTNLDLYQQQQNENMVVNLLLLCSAMNLLNSKYLTEEKINYAHKMLEKWHATLSSSYGKEFERFLAHMHMHYAEITLNHGSVSFRNCFQGESVVGFIGRRVHSKENALLQMTNRLIKWKYGCTKIDLNENLDLFIKNIIKDSTEDEFIQEEGHDHTGVHNGGNIHYDLENTNFKDKQILWNRFPGKKIYVLQEIKIDHFIIKSAHLAPRINDSIIYMDSILEGNKYMTPYLVHLIIAVGDKLFFVMQVFDVVIPLASSLEWINNLATKRLLTNERFSFPSCFIVSDPLPGYQIVVKSKIVTKGFMFIFKNKNIIFPLNCFDHD